MENNQSLINQFNELKKNFEELQYTVIILESKLNSLLEETSEDTDTKKSKSNKQKKEPSLYNKFIGSCAKKDGPQDFSGISGNEIKELTVESGKENKMASCAFAYRKLKENGKI